LSKKQSRESAIDAGPLLIRLERLSRLLRQASQTPGLNPAQWEALRYLARANFLSNTPGALARYLGATKGTTSQTVLALIKKGLVTKTMRSADARSVILKVNEAGEKILQNDPLQNIEKSISDLKPKIAKRFAKAVQEILNNEIQRQNEPRFGTCKGCTHAAREEGAGHCQEMKMIIPEAETLKLCFYHQPKPL
jgi:DNA-binding MarR family transcriptional regulator